MACVRACVFVCLFVCLCVCVGWWVGVFVCGLEAKKKKIEALPTIRVRVSKDIVIFFIFGIGSASVRGSL